MIILNSDENLEYLNILKYPKMQFEKGSFSFITGKSGTGKSTYLKLLNSTLIPSKGTIFYKGKNYHSFPVLDYRKNVLLVPQEVFLLNVSIEDNFKYFYDAREEQLISKLEITKYLEICCLDFKPNTPCNTLSGGEKQRVFLSIFLSLAKTALLLDEPTSALDKTTSYNLLGNIKSYAKENDLTCICVSHDENLTSNYSDHTYRLGGKNE